MIIIETAGVHSVVALRPYRDRYRAGRGARSLRRELCESRGGRPGLPFPNSPYGLDVKHH